MAVENARIEVGIMYFSVAFVRKFCERYFKLWPAHWDVDACEAIVPMHVMFSVGLKLSEV